MNSSGKGQGKNNSDIVFAVAILAFSALIYWQTLSLPAPRYEPMGSAALPRALSVIMSVLALFVLVRAVWQRQPPTQTADPDAAAPHAAGSNQRVVSRPWLAAFAFVTTVIYVAVMDQKLIGYPVATIAYLSICCLLLTRFDWRQLRWIVPFSVTLSLVCYFVFTRIFYIDLP